MIFINVNKELHIPAWDYLNTSNFPEISHQFRANTLCQKKSNKRKNLRTQGIMEGMLKRTGHQARSHRLRSSAETFLGPNGPNELPEESSNFPSAWFANWTF